MIRHRSRRSDFECFGTQGSETRWTLVALRFRGVDAIWDASLVDSFCSICYQSVKSKHFNELPNPPRNVFEPPKPQSLQLLASNEDTPFLAIRLRLIRFE